VAPRGTVIRGERDEGAGERLWSFRTSGGQVHSVTVASGVVYMANTNNGAAPDAHDVYAPSGMNWRIAGERRGNGIARMVPGT